MPRRVRWPLVGAVTAAASIVLLGPAVLAGALDSASARWAGTPPPVLRQPVGLPAGVAGGSPGGSGSEDSTLGAIGPGETTVTYCAHGGMSESLDVHEPTPPPTGAVPAVVYVHGGGWTGGDSSFTPDSLVGQVASTIEARGWVVISINYRLAPRFPWPAQIEDASCAIRFLRANAAALHIDPRHIGAIGDSAGGQIVALLGLAGPAAGFDVGPYADQSSSVQSVVDLYGPSDLTAPDWRRSPVVQAVAPDVFGTTLGPGPSGTPAPAFLKAASPVTYVGWRAPPFLIIQGDEDSVVPPEQSVELADRLRAAGNTPTLVMVHGAQHEFVPATGGSVTPDVNQLAAEAAAFLVQHLGSL
ncbi:MAG TPA: alpha/beta hydrolase [Acidimicrobiales bacterium]|nr:alpha/beta hydrolase [Acidimicrobiales bacterium]